MVGPSHSVFSAALFSFHAGRQDRGIDRVEDAEVRWSYGAVEPQAETGGEEVLRRVPPSPSSPVLLSVGFSRGFLYFFPTFVRR